MRVFLIFFLVIGLTFACAQRKLTPPEAEEAPIAEGMSTEGMAATEEIKPPEEMLQGIGEEEIAKEEIAKIDTAEIETPLPMKLTEEELRKVFKDIHFDYDRYDIKDEDRLTLRAIADWMLNNASARLVIEGHCDERGTKEYNLGLGDRRATATKDYLISLGVIGNRFQRVSFGEESPFCNEHNEDCWRQNRRVHFVVIEGE